MFEKRSISILSYNIETVLVEKMETILSRAETNTRMRDYYDIYIILLKNKENINKNILIKAFKETCKKRNSTKIIYNTSEILNSLQKNIILEKQWNKYSINSYYIDSLTWSDSIIATWKLAEMLTIV